MVGKRHVRLQEGKCYINAGGGCYKVLHALDEDRYRVENICSGWVCIVHVITLYENGYIEWDYSTDGHFKKTRIYPLARP